MALAAERAGLEVFKVVYDSTYKQFDVSENYRNDVPLVADREKGLSGFLARKARKWRYQKLARDMNREGRGDQAAFFLRRRSA